MGGAMEANNMTEENNTEQEGDLETCQIVIQKVDNGFVLHAAGVDGAKAQKRLIATDIRELRKRLHEVADILYASPKASDVISRTMHSMERS
jgi:hypothetical protein